MKQNYVKLEQNLLNYVNLDKNHNKWQKISLKSSKLHKNEGKYPEAQENWTNTLKITLKLRKFNILANLPHSEINFIKLRKAEEKFCKLGTPRVKSGKIQNKLGQNY